MYTILLCIFIIFYYAYSKILRFKICFKNCEKNKCEKIKRRKSNKTIVIRFMVCKSKLYMEHHVYIPKDLAFYSTKKFIYYT